jgi:hypothetical protein
LFEKGSRDLFENNFTQIEKSKAKIGGMVIFTGALYLYDSYIYNNGTITKTMYYLNGFSDKNLNLKYIQVEGSIHSESDKRFIEVQKIQNSDPLVARLQEKANSICKEAIKNRSRYDLNRWKRVGYLRKFTLDSVLNMDLNKLEFRRKSEILFLDFENQIAGFDCGQVVVEENILTGSYLHYVAIVSTKSKELKLEEVLIKNSGYFHE